LYYWARSAGLPTHDAADLVQEVLVVLVQKLPEFEYDPHQSFRGWLRTITLNKWRERCRRFNAQPDQNGDTGLSSVVDADPSLLFDEADYRAQLVQRYHAVLVDEHHVLLVAPVVAGYRDWRRKPRHLLHALCSKWLEVDDEIATINFVLHAGDGHLC
jgi:DNA-directed RNA polymerase specialized sigma24 family protein